MWIFDTGEPMETPRTAADLLEAAAKIETDKKELIAFLRARIAADNAELAQLGAKRIRKVREAKPKRGRPVGSRNQKSNSGYSLEPMTGINAAPEAMADHDA